VAVDAKEIDMGPVIGGVPFCLIEADPFFNYDKFIMLLSDDEIEQLNRLKRGEP